MSTAIDDIEHSDDTSTIVPNSIQILSDIHLEFSGTYDQMKKVKKGSKVLALLGDIGYPSKAEYQQFIKDMASLFECVIIIAGNHEYYKEEFYHANELMSNIANEYKNVYFLNNDYLDLPDSILGPNIRILGTTLWTDYPKDATIMFEYKINDFRRIKIKESILHATNGINGTNDMNDTTDTTNATNTTLKAQSNNDELQSQTAQNKQNETENLKTSMQVKMTTDDDSTNNVDKENKEQNTEKKEENTQDTDDTEDRENKESKESKEEAEEEVAQLLSCKHINKIHENSVQWIENELLKAQELNKRVIVLTHHAPTDYLCVSDFARKDLICLNTNYCNMEKFFKAPLIGWFSGHTHHNCDFYVKCKSQNEDLDKDGNGNGNSKDWYVRIASNQQGYLPIGKATKDYSECKVIPFGTQINESNIISSTVAIDNIDSHDHEVENKMDADEEDEQDEAGGDMNKQDILVIDYDTLVNEKITSKIGLVPKKLYDLNTLNILGDNNTQQQGNVKKKNNSANKKNSNTQRQDTKNCLIL